MTKRRKPKKPVSKKVLALQDELRRRRGVRDLAKRFLIVCEDNKSAPAYFNALKRLFNLSAASVQVVGSDDRTQPLQIVEKAVDLKSASSKHRSGTVAFDEVWCVIDGDYEERIQNARFKANHHNIKLAISTKCFEYWILLHFEENSRPTADCDQLVHSLRQSHLRQYEKGKCSFLDVVPHVREACRRAEKLRNPGINRGELPELQNPCSEVYKLVNALLAAADS